MTLNDSSLFNSKIKIIFLGDPTVGKTSIISAIRHKQFEQKQQATVGIDFFAQIVNKNKQAYKLQFWDTAGQQRFRSIIPSYVRNSHIGIIVFDLQNRCSYDNVKNWLQSFKEYSSENSKILVIGNKSDILHHAVQLEQAQRRFNKQNILFIPISAKTSQNIEILTQKIINCIEIADKDLINSQSRTKSYKKLQNIIEDSQNPAKNNRIGKCCKA